MLSRSFLERGPSPPSRSWPACERLSVAPRSAVETALVVEEEFVTDLRRCHLSSLTISFTRQSSGLSQRSAPLPCEMTLQSSFFFLEPKMMVQVSVQAQAEDTTHNFHWARVSCSLQVSPAVRHGPADIGVQWLRTLRW